MENLVWLWAIRNERNGLCMEVKNTAQAYIKSGLKNETSARHFGAKEVAGIALRKRKVRPVAGSSSAAPCQWSHAGCFSSLVPECLNTYRFLLWASAGVADGVYIYMLISPCVFSITDRYQILEGKTVTEPFPVLICTSPTLSILLPKWSKPSSLALRQFLYIASVCEDT